MRRYVLLLAAAACGGDGMVSGPRPATVDISNELDASVRITLAGTPMGALGAGERRTLQAASGDAMQWAMVPRQWSDGTPMQDDIPAQVLPVAAGAQTLRITNQVAGGTYFTPRISRASSTVVHLALVDGNALRCLGWIRGPIGNFPLGYYRLTPTTELRAYDSPTSCSGAFRTWTSAQLSAFEPNTGVVRLNSP